MTPSPRVRAVQRTAANPEERSLLGLAARGQRLHGLFVTRLARCCVTLDSSCSATG